MNKFKNKCKESSKLWSVAFLLLAVFMSGCGVWKHTSGTNSNAPTVIFTVPLTVVAPGVPTTGVAINSKISATFSKTMNPATINITTFTLKQGTTSVSGTVAYSGVTAVFTPSSNLAANTTYTATITTGAKDLAGNAMTANYTWKFTTGAAPDTTPPTVTFTIPATVVLPGVPTIDVAINSKMSAAFSEPMDPLTINTTTFTLKQGATTVTGTVTYSGVTAVFTPSSNLANSTTYTATITTGAKDLAGNTLVTNYVWSFTTGAAPDTTPPTVISTIPANGATNVAINSTISATFSEAMDPLSFNSALIGSVTGPGGSNVNGTIVYVPSSNTVIFTPTNPLNNSSTYIVTLIGGINGVTDLAGNAMAANYVFSFQTAAAPDTTPPTITLTSPVNLAVDVLVNSTIKATFSEAMNPLTITNLNFTVKGPGGTPVTGTVSYNAVNYIATFVPNIPLAFSTTYTALVTTGTTDVAGNALGSGLIANPWTFTTAAAPSLVNLGTAVSFGAMGGAAGITNQGLLTVINGDISTTGASTLVTGFQDSVGGVYTITPLNDGIVKGTIDTAPPPPGGSGVGGNATTFAIATQALADAQTAYNSLTPASMPGGIDPGAGQLGGLTLAPGIYKAAGGSFLLTGSDLTLDGQGNPNATWVFQMASSLTVGGPGAPRSIILINGAQAKNVFWQVGSAATINAAGGGTMVGTIIAYSGVSLSTAGNVNIVTLNGRALGLNASVTMVNTIVNVPAP